MPVIDSMLDANYHNANYIPSVGAVVEYVEQNSARSITNTETTTELIVYDI
jgi:hypothetical protein